MKKHLCILLLFAILLPLLPLSGSSAAANLISSVSVTITEPYRFYYDDASYPSFYATADGVYYMVEDYNTGYWKSGVLWYDETDQKYLTESDPFITGHEYKVTISLIPVHGFGAEFAESGITGTVNGQAASDIRYWNTENIAVCARFTCKTILPGVGFYIADEPVVGGNPDYSVSRNGTGNGISGCYDIEEKNGDGWRNGACWYDKTEGRILSAEDVFQAEHCYAVAVSIIAKDGYIFLRDETTASSNWGDCDEIVYINESNIWALCSKQALYPITQAAISLTRPWPGQTPDYSASMNGEGYKLYNNFIWNGIEWISVEDSSTMDSSDVFNEGKAYRAIVHLTPKDGYLFDDNCTATVNGQEASLDFIYSSFVVVDYMFTCEALGNGWQKIDGKWYFGKDGSAVVGWYKDGSKWYYFDSNGVMQSGWIQLGGKWYYLGNEMKTGWQQISNKWYYFNNSGVMQSGWIQLGGKWYYLDNEMKTGWQKISSKWYYFDAKGVMQSGWIQLGGKWYYLGNEMKTGWQKISGKWYYFNSNGAMQTGWIQLGGKWYYLGNEMKTGWQKISNKWYYFDSNGVMQTGWIQLSGKWYYLGTNGAMVTGTQIIDGKTYIFDSNGVWQK